MPGCLPDQLPPRCLLNIRDCPPATHPACPHRQLLQAPSSSRPGPLLLPSLDSIIQCSFLAEIPSGVWNFKRGSPSSGLKR